MIVKTKVIRVALRERSSGVVFFFFFQAEDGIRDYKVTGVQTCALPICVRVGLPVLIVSGAIDQDRKADANTPIGWVLDRLDASELEGAGDLPIEIERSEERRVGEECRSRGSPYH